MKIWKLSSLTIGAIVATSFAIFSVANVPYTPCVSSCSNVKSTSIGGADVPFHTPMDSSGIEKGLINSITATPTLNTGTTYAQSMSMGGVLSITVPNYAIITKVSFFDKSGAIGQNINGEIDAVFWDFNPVVTGTSTFTDFSAYTISIGDIPHILFSTVSNCYVIGVAAATGSIGACTSGNLSETYKLPTTTTTMWVTLVSGSNNRTQVSATDVTMRVTWMTP